VIIVITIQIDSPFRWALRPALFWLNLPAAYELAVGEKEIGEKVMNEVQPVAA
jgi:hypothetical protein